MKIKTLIKTGLWGMAALVLAACASEDTIEKNEQKQTEPRVVASFSGQFAAPTSQAKTRTTGKHVFHTDMKAEWSTGDRIWVKDINGTWHRSEPAEFLTADHSRANFKLLSGNYGFNPEVRYVGESSNVNQVTVSQTQNQTTLGEFSHLGASGDCGTATAKGGGGDYEFTLQHKSAYICFYPRVQNEALHHNVRLERITVKLPYGVYDYLSGIFDFTNGSYRPNIETLNPSYNITLETHSAPIPSATRNDTCFYMVISPNPHMGLKVYFEVKDPTTNVSYTVTHDLSGNFEAGKIYDHTAWLDKDIKAYQFYMWGAKFDYWYNHLKADGTPDGNYPQDNTDPRWYSEGYFPGSSCRKCPNVNELCWYAYKGNPHWDTRNMLYAENGHLQQTNIGGIWLKKKAKIMADEHITESQMSEGYPKNSPKDWRTAIGQPPPSMPLSIVPVPNHTDYFFLPALGRYTSGARDNTVTHYWSSTNYAIGTPHAWSLYFSSSHIQIFANYRKHGFLAIPFE